MITKYHQNLKVKTYNRKSTYLLIYFYGKQKSTLVSLQSSNTTDFLNIYTNKFSFVFGLDNIIIYFNFKFLIIMGPIKTSIGPYRWRWAVFQVQLSHLNFKKCYRWVEQQSKIPGHAPTLLSPYRYKLESLT